MLKKLFSELRKIREDGSFARNVTIVSLWGGLGIVVQLLLSPIITRIYSPDQYGVFTLFSSVAINLLLISSLKYNEAIIVAESREHRNQLLGLCFSLVAGISILVAFVFHFFGESLFHLLKIPSIGSAIYFIPVVLLLGGLLEILSAVNISKKKFFNNGLASFLLNLSSRVITILYGIFFQPRFLGLVLGDVFGRVVGFLVVLVSFKNLSRIITTFFSSISIRALAQVALRYKYFPLYILPTNILALLSGHLPIYFFQFQYNSSVVGSYALASSILEMINRLIPYSIAGVFFPKAVELGKESREQLIKGAFKIYWATYVLSLIIFVGIALLASTVFPWIFGDSWTTAGIFAGILTIQYAINFIAVSLADVYKVIGKQSVLLRTTGFSIILKVLTFILIFYYTVGEKEALLWFGCAGALGSVLQIAGVFIGLQIKIWKAFISLLALIVALLLVVGVIIF